MFRTKKALLLLGAGFTVFASGCGAGTWFKWLTVGSQLGYNITGILDNVGILTG